MSLSSAQRDWLKSRNARARVETARRSAAMTFVTALRELGFAKSEAVDAAATQFQVASSTIYRWQRCLWGTPSDEALFELAPRRMPSRLRRRA